MPTMKPFERDAKCPKCGDLASPKFIAASDPSNLGDDHLRWVCSCGYVWPTRCADAAPPAEPAVTMNNCNCGGSPELLNGNYVRCSKYMKCIQGRNPVPLAKWNEYNDAAHTRPTDPIGSPRLCFYCNDPTEPLVGDYFRCSNEACVPGRIPHPATSPVATHSPLPRPAERDAWLHLEPSAVIYCAKQNGVECRRAHSHTMCRVIPLTDADGLPFREVNHVAE